MEVTVSSERSGVAIMQLKGRLDVLSSQQLRDAVAEQASQKQVRLVIDLAGLEFIDSSGLGALIGALKTARSAGGDLRIAAATAQARAALKMTNLDRILTPHATVEEAAAGFGA